ncbi:MAG TPA: putative Ig domain-containing protein, partial [Ilumatobacteraceae bacterium]|nr:putative Ig domain-containing protein [Ilumatobacteraceae bacterium]
MERQPVNGAKAGRVDSGFSLIELIIAVVLSLLIGGVVVAALITSLNVSNTTTAQVGDSTDAGFITAFLTRDAQSAGGIVPTTALKDATVGISNVSTAWAGCTQAPAALVLRFSWIERLSTISAAQDTVAVTYAFDSTTSTLTRRLCRGGAATGTDVVLGRSLASASAVCNVAACTTASTLVTLSLTGKGVGAPLTTLRASLRGDTQAALTLLNTTPVPVLALGAGPTVGCPNVEMAGTGVVTVVGNALVDSLCATGTPITDTTGLLRPTGTASTVAGITDPYANRIKLVTPTCPATGTNPVVGASATAATVVVYPNAVAVTADTVFQPGRFIFCKGLEFTSGTITGTNVLLYIYTGTFEVKAAATVNLTGRSTTPTTDSQLLVWSFEANKPIKIAGGSRVSNYRGLLYAPTSKMELSSVLGGNIGSINTQGLKVTGAGQLRIGLTIPTIAVAPATTLAAGQVAVAYSNSSLGASGGTAPYTWSAAGLPAGLTMSATGVITGTPTAAGTSSAIIVTVFDTTKAAASFDYSMTINPALGISTASLPNGQVGVGYSAVLAPTGGTAPYTWSAVSGMPPGLSLGSAGAISGTPTLVGTYTVTVMVTDTFTNATRTYSNVVIIGSIVINGPALPNGQVGTAYGPTTISATGGTPPYTWTWTGAPPGLVLNATTGAVSGRPTNVGTYNVTMTASDTAGASAQATYPVTISMPACPTTNLPWKAQYYPTATLSGSPVLRDDADINFNWGAGSPISGIGSDNYSVRWIRTSNFAAGSYTFALNTDDGSRMYIDDVLVAPLNSWGAAQSTSYTQFLTGWHTIRVEYNEISGNARVSLVTTFVAAAQVASNGVTAVPSVNDNQPYFGELNLTLNNPSDVILAMSMSFTVAQTPGVSYHGQYTTIPNSDMVYSHETCGLVSYAFTLEQGLTIRTPGSWILAAQWDGTGTPRVTTGD